MKKKLLILTLCFTLVFSGLNYKKSYADGGLISVPMIATISALAVGSNIVLSSNNDLYDFGRVFYDWVDNHNELTWDTVQGVFASSVVLTPSKLVSVDSKFLDIVKEFFDDKSNDYSDVITNVCGIPVYSKMPSNGKGYGVNYPLLEGQSITIGNISFSRVNGDMVFNNNNSSALNAIGFYSQPEYGHELFFVYEYISSLYSNGYRLYHRRHDNKSSLTWSTKAKAYTLTLDRGINYKDYNWDNVESKKENESVSLPIPGNLGQLVGQGSTDFWDNTDGLVGSGDLSIPNVDDPSIDLDDNITSFPSTDVDDPSVPGVDDPSVPGESFWSNITDYVIGLVVPSDTYWTDTWGGLYNNFTNSFPMVDMDGFNDLVTGEKKFPNIDIDIMGVRGRVVNGDVVNSIVDWLRPIIAGFMMLCLMLFNYRKIYKLIRNSEPFGGIAPGTSDFKTGISEYNKEPVVKAVDMAAEYRAWKENGGK